MGFDPVPAIGKLLDRTGMTLDAFDVIELNEACAAQALACTRALRIEDADLHLNPKGEAIALGHPPGASGARIVGTAALELSLTSARYAQSASGRGSRRRWSGHGAASRCAAAASILVPHGETR
ncbi:beta-ketoadipyl CoA thiolase [Citreicella sp. 357]|nr:beta-ketoadipyl CoA thiolase [Citreicella sp. 357]